MATIAVFIALGGVAWAAATINSKDVVDNSLKSVDLKDSKGVRGVDVKDGTLKPDDIAKDVTGTGHGTATINAGACEDTNLAVQNFDLDDSILVLPDRDGDASPWDERLALAGYGALTDQLGFQSIPARICNVSNQTVTNAQLTFTVLGFAD